VVLSLEETDAIGQIQNMGQIADIEPLFVFFRFFFRPTETMEGKPLSNPLNSRTMSDTVLASQDIRHKYIQADDE
jgi:hypothetical protein